MRTRKEKLEYQRKYYLEHGGKERQRRRKGTAKHDVSSIDKQREREEASKKKERVYCIGHYCWEQGKTFMSPDKKSIRMCPRCQAHAASHPESPYRAAYQKQTKGTDA